MFRGKFLGFRLSGKTGVEGGDAGTSSRGTPVPSPKEIQAPTDPPRGVYLRKHHLQTYLIGLWILCIIAYIASIEKAIHAHQLSQAVEDPTPESLSFGLRGTRRRQETVQIFSFARTILTAVHIPIITATLSSTLPILTQRTKGRGTSINAEQLFMLADRTWAGAGGWYEAFRVRRLSWEWWKLTILVFACFAGFPFVTLGYIATSDQYWSPYQFQGVYAFRFNQTLPAIRQSMISELSDWIYRFPQREIGMTRFQKPCTSFGPDGKTPYSFYPPADQTNKLGHFVTYLMPLDAEPRLVVANTMGMLQNLQCRTLERSEKPKYIDMSKTEWKCMTDCANATDSISENMCHAQSSKGRPGPSGQSAQITSCGQPANTFDGVSNKVILTKARIVEVEVAYKLDPPYESVSTSVFPPPQNAWSFRAGDNITADRYYVDILRCSAALIPGDGIVDSVIRRFMHFMPYGLGLAHETPEVMDYLEQALPEMLNITLHPVLSLLHSTFLSSNYGPNNNISGSFNTSLPAFFGLQRPTSESSRSTKIFPTEVSAKTGYNPGDKFVIDNMVRLNGDKFIDAFVSLANSSFVGALPKFIVSTRRPGFSYQTDVKLTRGIPMAIAPLVILIPVLIVFYLAAREWNTPTWTEFLDSFAMFRLGRSWERELDGSGALKLKECWQVRNIPGVVGDAVPRKVMENSGKEYVGEIKLGGEGELSPRVKYA